MSRLDVPTFDDPAVQRQLQQAIPNHAHGTFGAHQSPQRSTRRLSPHPFSVLHMALLSGQRRKNLSSMI
ncbi:hypothetical protein BYT27DRAFT_6556735 [Phlegmacium glaucopus]|nr:hypothetical protein BYT27DRAFT_6556735 [Phlegmacium glaucopus]